MLSGEKRRAWCMMVFVRRATMRALVRAPVPCGCARAPARSCAAASRVAAPRRGGVGDEQPHVGVLSRDGARAGGRRPDTAEEAAAVAGASSRVSEPPLSPQDEEKRRRRAEKLAEKNLQRRQDAERRGRGGGRDHQRTPNPGQRPRRANVSQKAAAGADEDFNNPTGIELMFLGTQAATPSVGSNVTSMCLRLDGSLWLFDCGEGTQHQFMKTRLKLRSVEGIFITHTHGDHIFGLPGLIIGTPAEREDGRPPPRAAPRRAG